MSPPAHLKRPRWETEFCILFNFNLNVNGFPWLLTPLLDSPALEHELQQISSCLGIGSLLSTPRACHWLWAAPPCSWDPLAQWLPFSWGQMSEKGMAVNPAACIPNTSGRDWSNTQGKSVWAGHRQHHAGVHSWSCARRQGWSPVSKQRRTDTIATNQLPCSNLRYSIF